MRPIRSSPTRWRRPGAICYGKMSPPRWPRLPRRWPRSCRRTATAFPILRCSITPSGARASPRPTAPRVRKSFRGLATRWNSMGSSAGDANRGEPGDTLCGRVCTHSRTRSDSCCRTPQYQSGNLNRDLRVDDTRVDVNSGTSPHPPKIHRLCQRESPGPAGPENGCNLADSPVTKQQLQEAFLQYGSPDIVEILVIDQHGILSRIFP